MSSRSSICRRSRPSCLRRSKSGKVWAIHSRSWRKGHGFNGLKEPVESSDFARLQCSEEEKRALEAFGTTEDGVRYP